MKVSVKAKTQGHPLANRMDDHGAMSALYLPELWPKYCASFNVAIRHYPSSHSAPVCDSLPMLTHSLSDLCG